MNRDELRRRFGQARVGRLGTVDERGHPHLVPVCFALVDRTVYSAVDEKPKRTRQLRRLANIEATGRASVLVDEYGENWTELWWVRVDGPARVVTDPAEAARAVAALVAKYPQYGNHPPTGPVLAVEVTATAGWAYSNSE